MTSKLYNYKVWYSKQSRAAVRARSADGARKQAWDMLSDFKYGWTKKDFLKSATVEKVS